MLHAPEALKRVCQRVSPVFIVVRGGTLMHSSGSTIAASGMKAGLFIVFFSVLWLMTDT